MKKIINTQNREGKPSLLKRTKQMEKISKGNYLLQNGFQIIKDDSQWVVMNADENLLDRYIMGGFDQCFLTLSEAYEYVKDIERYI